MTELVQVAVAGDETEAEEMQALLHAAGIDAEIDAGADDPFTVRVPEGEVEAAREALEALTEPDDLIAEP
jgi:type III secretory pathway lipoprotein EscJ